MSNRPCNFCEYRLLLKKYGKERLILRPALGSLGGTNVYLLTNGKEKLIVWYMELPDKCDC